MYNFCIYKILKDTTEGRSQDGRVGGHGVHISSQLGHLRGAGGGPRTPQGKGGIPVRPGPHLSTMTWLHPTACKLQCWMPQAKQPARQEHSPTHQKN